jgi:hypothetical protein
MQMGGGEETPRPFYLAVRLNGDSEQGPLRDFRNR